VADPRRTTHRRDPGPPGGVGGSADEVEAAAPAYDELVTGPDLRVDLGRVITPTLVLAGELDVTVPAAHLREVAEAMPHGTFSLVEEVGHLVEVEAPRVWRQRVCDFLDGERC